MLHSNIEASLRMTLQVISLDKPHDGNICDIEKMSLDISYLDLVKVFHAMGLVKKAMCEDLIHFNSMRNKIIHKLLLHAQIEGGKKIEKTEYDKAFRLGIKLDSEACNLIVESDSIVNTSKKKE